MPPPAKSWSRLAAILAAVAVLASLAWWKFASGPTVQTAIVTKGDAAAVVYATGVVEPEHWAKVAALQRKRIVELCRCEGQQVKKGQVLARLDDAEERAMLTELTARLKRYQEDAERLKALVERNVTARTTYDEKLTQVREQLSRVAAQRDRIDNLSLRAPMDGIVLRRDGEVGEIAGTGTNDVLLWVGDPTPLRVVSEVNEEDIGKVKVGQKTLLRHEGSPGVPLESKVASITPKGDPQTKTFRVYLALPDDTPLRIGMSVEANIVVAEARDAVLVPSESIGNGSSVQIVKDDRITLRKVETGIRGTRLTEIRSGLTDGERVVTPFKAELAEGTRVKPAAAATNSK
ncbi:MAG: efflux RND transporter periplasmic adaptor subunit [Hyphomicrobiaceae bacterium]